MVVIELEELKRHARVVGTARDNELALCGDAAEETVMNYLHTSISEMWDTYGCIPATVKKAIYAVAIGMFDYPAGTDGRQQFVCPFSILAAIESYKVLTNR